MEKIISLLQGNPPFYVATVDGDKPKVRPFNFCMEYNGRLYFGTGKHKQTHKQLVMNPNVEICNSANGQWIRISGVATFDDSEDTIAKAFESNPMLKRIYNNETGLMPSIFYLKNGVAEIADMQGNFEKINF